MSDAMVLANVLGTLIGMLLTHGILTDDDYERFMKMLDEMEKIRGENIQE